MFKPKTRILLLVVAAICTIYYLLSPIIQINSLYELYSISPLCIKTLGTPDSTNAVLNHQIASPIYLWPFVVMVIFMGGLSIVTIFLYARKRLLGIMSVINISLLLTFMFSIILLGYIFEKPLEGASLQILPSNFVCLCAVIAYWIVNYAVRKTSQDQIM